MDRKHRRSGVPASFGLLLAAVFAASATMAVPAAAATAARALDPATVQALLRAGVGFAAASPVLREALHKLEGSEAISRGRDGRLTILLLGSDYRPTLAGERTDTIIVMTINPKTKAMAAVSIPRDVARVRLPNGSIYTGRINTMYAYYRKSLGSAAKALTRVKEIIEFNLQVEIDYYALIRMPGYNELIDHVNGVTVSIPREIKDPKFWDSPHGPQGIYFPAASAWTLRGNTTLCNGYYKTGQLSKPGARCTRAIVYVRSRKGKANSDYKRTRRAQEVVAAAISKVRARGSSNLGPLLNAAKAQVDKKNLITNLPLTSANALELYSLFANASLQNQVVLRPKKYATKITGTAKIELKLAAVRELTKVWFARVN